MEEKNIGQSTELNGKLQVTFGKPETIPEPTKETKTEPEKKKEPILAPIAGQISTHQKITEIPKPPKNKEAEKVVSGVQEIYDKDTRKMRERRLPNGIIEEYDVKGILYRKRFTLTGIVETYNENGVLESKTLTDGAVEKFDSNGDRIYEEEKVEKKSRRETAKEKEEERQETLKKLRETIENTTRRLAEIDRELALGDESAEITN